MEQPLRQSLLDGERAGSRYALRTPRGLPAGMVGLHQGARAGSSLEFKEHRDYEPGDDLRHIDWNAYARSDHLVVKLFHEEVTPHLDVLLDGSRSMALAGSAKAAATLGLAGFFAAAADNAGFSHRVWLAQDGCAQLTGSAGRPDAWEVPTFDFRGNVADAFHRRPPQLRPRGVRILISDLFWPGEPLHIVAPCAERATALVVIQLLAAADVQPPERGNLRLIDAETAQPWELLVDEPAIERYRAAMERHQQLWRNACRQAGALLISVVAEDWLRDWRLDELVAAEFLQVM
jgi:uncharacterized protein (DUF58 family)